MIKIKKRTFEALNYPKGSKKRQELNEYGLTSEFMPEIKYSITVNGHEFFAFKTYKEALDVLNEMKSSH